jgi:hypothetical protein
MKSGWGNYPKKGTVTATLKSYHLCGGKYIDQLFRWMGGWIVNCRSIVYDDQNLHRITTASQVYLIDRMS